jgi:hypothetical protein
MLPIRQILLLAVAFVLVACPRDDVYDPSAHPPAPIEVPPEAAPPEVVRVLDTGAEPREVLRYRIPEGFEGSLDITMHMRLTSPQSLELPPIRMRMHLTDVETDGEGFRYRFTFDEPVIDTDEPHRLPPDRVEALRQDISAIAGIRGYAVLDGRGLVREVAYDGSAPSVRLDQLMNELEQSVRSMTVPLPAEAVGVGARWEVVQELTLNELTFEQRNVTTLQSRDGNHLVLDAEVAQSAGQQQIHNPQLPPGARMVLDQMTGSAKGVANIDLTSLLPHAPTTSSSTTRMSMHVNMNDQRQPVEMALGVDLTLEAVAD